MHTFNFPRLACYAALTFAALLVVRILLGCAAEPPAGVYGRPGDTSYQIYQDLQRERQRLRLQHRLRR